MTDKTKLEFASVLQVLHYMQKNLACPKNQVNKFGGYKYRNCEDILEAVKKILPHNAIVTVSDEIVNIGDRFYVKATAKLEYAESGEITSTAYAREEENKKGMDASQLTGATSSYARKYALNGLFAIDDNKDSDATNTHGKEEQSKPKQQPAQKKQEPVKPKAQPKASPEILSLCTQIKTNLQACEEFEVLETLWKQVQPDLLKIKQSYQEGYDILCKLYEDKKAPFFFNAG